MIKIYKKLLLAVLVATGTLTYNTNAAEQNILSEPEPAQIAYEFNNKLQDVASGIDSILKSDIPQEYQQAVINEKNVMQDHESKRLKDF